MSQPPRESLVRPEFGPSLPALVQARLGVPARVLKIAAALLVAAVLAVVLFGAAKSRDERFTREAAPAFNLRWSSAALHRRQVPGAMFVLDSRRGDLFLQSYTVQRLVLPRYSGAVSALLPTYAAGHIARLRKRFPGFQLADEGKARINEAPGYQVGYRFKRGERTVYGRDVLLIPDEPGVREGVVLRLLQTNAAGAHQPADVGAVGALKKPLRSFRFGTDAQ